MPNDEWFTPPLYLNAVRAVLRVIDLDPASCAAAQIRVRARRYYTIDDDGLAKPWNGRIFLNPPYSRNKIGKFADKLLAEIAAGRVVAAIMLVDNCADTKWFGRLARKATLICFTEGRIRFITPDGRTPGSPPKGQCWLYFGRHRERFRSVFQRLGWVARSERPLQRSGITSRIVPQSEMVPVTVLIPGQGSMRCRAYFPRRTRVSNG